MGADEEVFDPVFVFGDGGDAEAGAPLVEHVSLSCFGGRGRRRWEICGHGVCEVVITITMQITLPNVTNADLVCLKSSSDGVHTGLGRTRSGGK